MSFLVKGLFGWFFFFELYAHAMIKPVKPVCIAWVWDRIGAHCWTQY